MTKLKIDINKLVSSVQSSFGKDKGRASQVTTGVSISKPTEDKDFICWKDSPWETLVGIKGLPFGKVVQVAGRPDSGKSSTASMFIKQAQDQNVLVILWDTEGKFSANRFNKYFGGNSDELIVVTSRMILEGGGDVERIVHSAKEQDPDSKILIVWDSVGGTLAKNENENSLDQTKQMAAGAKENGSVMRAFIRLMEKYKNNKTSEESIAVLLINQSYANIGAPGQKESGGQKVEYFSSIIVQLTRKSDLTKIVKGVKRKIGIVSKAKVKKNHLFDGEDSVAELDIVVTAGSIDLLSNKKVKKEGDDWDGEKDTEIESDE